MSFDEITKALSETFEGQADVAANTFEGRIERLKLAFEDVRDTLAERFLPFLEKVIDYLLVKGIPALDAFIAGLTGDEGLSAGLDETQRSAENFGKSFAGVIGIVQGFITFVREAIGLVVSLANELIKVVNIIPGVNIGSIPNPAPSAARSSLPSVPSASRTSGGTYTTGQGVTNITVNAIDSESAARAVTKALNESAARSNPYLSRAAVKK
jgi:hypothetical protein